MQRVLLVDGDMQFRKEMKDRLKRRGVSVACAGTAREGLRMYRRGRPACVFAEAELPDGDGFPVLEEAHRQNSGGYGKRGIFPRPGVFRPSRAAPTTVCPSQWMIRRWTDCCIGCAGSRTPYLQMQV